MSFNCELCKAIVKKSYFNNISNICPICDNEIKRKEEIKHNIYEKECYKLIPKDYNYNGHDLKHNKYYYSQILIRIQSNIPKKISNMEHWQLSQQLNKIKLKLNKYIIKDLIKFVIEYTDQQFEYIIKSNNYKLYPIHYLT